MASEVNEILQHFSTNEGSQNRISHVGYDKLKVDNNLQLSRKNFGESLKTLLQKFCAIDNSERIAKTSIYPSPGLLAKFASLVYENKNDNEYDRDYEKRLQLPHGWKLLTTAVNKKTGNKGYFGIAYWNPERQHVIIAHRGKKPPNAAWSNLKEILHRNITPQINSASTFSDEIIRVLVDIETHMGANFELFFTGHSLGGWLAQITTFTANNLEIVENNFRQASEKKRYHAHTVVFESPGCKEMLQKMGKLFVGSSVGCSIDVNDFDITTYLDAPNKINTCCEHLGTVNRMFTDFTGELLENHDTAPHADTILKEFDPSTGMVLKDTTGKLKLQKVLNWPRSDGLLVVEHKELFYKWLEKLEKNSSEEANECFKFKKCQIPDFIQYQTTNFDPSMTSLTVFTRQEKQFLDNYSWLQQLNLSEFYDLLGKKGTNSDLHVQANDLLHNFCIQNNTIRSTSAEALQKLIPCVKQLVQFFIKEKDVEKMSLTVIAATKKLYRITTKQYIADMEKRILDFNGDCPAVGDFLSSSKQIWLLQVPFDTWIGFKQVYRAFQKWTKTSEDNDLVDYNALQLKRLLEANELLSFQTLTSSTDEPHLLMVDCDKELTERNTTKNFFEELLQQNPKFKVVLICQGSTIWLDFDSSKYFAAKLEEFTWLDMTPKSHKALWKSPVIFQGNSKEISFNLLINENDKDLLEKVTPLMLIQNEPLKIGNPIKESSECNKSYYVPRYVHRQEAVRTEIIRDQEKGTFADLLAYTEEEFIRLCGEDPGKNVHWLSFSENLIWKKSQGTLDTLRPYIDNDKTKRVPEDEIMLNSTEKLVILSGPPGMGKTSFMDRFSKLIKEALPTFWIVRLDLNNYTKEFEEQLSKTSFETQATDATFDFLFTDLMRLETQLEKEVFKHIIKTTGNIYFIFDGFDEISPDYTEMFIDFVQILRKTALATIWITTRLNMKVTLENQFQQFSYTLEAFSEDSQVNFVTKFWIYELGQPETEVERIKYYSESLIKHFGISVKDKELQLTGMPLQIKILAEIYQDQAHLLCTDDKTQEISQIFSLVDIYAQFFETKLNIYGKKKMKLPIGNVRANKLIKSENERLKKEHQFFALKVLFNNDQLTILKADTHLVGTEKLTRIGIVQNVGKNTDFIHRTYVDYFVASYLWALMFQDRKPLKEESKLLLQEILVNDEYETLRAFLNSLLVKHNIPNGTITEHGRLISKSWSETDLYAPLSDTSLHVACTNSLFSIVKFILSILTDDPISLKRLLFSENKNARIPLHCAVTNKNAKVVVELLEYAEAKLGKESVKLMVLKEDDMGIIPLHFAKENESFDSARVLLEYIKNNLDIENVR